MTEVDEAMDINMLVDKESVDMLSYIAFENPANVCLHLYNMFYYIIIIIIIFTSNL